MGFAFAANQNTAYINRQSFPAEFLTEPCIGRSCVCSLKCCHSSVDGLFKGHLGDYWFCYSISAALVGIRCLTAVSIVFLSLLGQLFSGLTCILNQHNPSLVCLSFSHYLSDHPPSHLNLIIYCLVISYKNPLIKNTNLIQYNEQWLHS
jgi:hypothetical protein